MAVPATARNANGLAMFGEHLRNGLVVLGLACIGLGSLLSPPALYSGLVLLMAVSLSERSFLHFLRRSPWAWLAGAMTLYTLLRSLLAQQAVPAEAEIVGKDGGQLLIIAGIPALLLGWQLARRPRWLGVLLAGFVVSLVVFFLLEAEQGTLMEHLRGSGQRLQFGGHGNALGGLYGVGVLAASCLFYRCLSAAGRPSGDGVRRLVRYGLALLLLVAAAFFTLVVLWNQSRTAWFGLLAAVVPVLIHTTLLARHAGRRMLFRRMALASPLVAVFVGLVLAGSELVDRRFQPVTEALEGIAEIQVDERASGSVETRARIFLAGSAAIGERPLFGHGPSYFEKAVVAAGAEDLRRWAHFHNLYLQVAVALGLVGLAGFLALYLLPLWYLRPVRGGDSGPAVPRTFAASLWLFVMVLGLATIRHDDPAGQALYILALGVVVMVMILEYPGGARPAAFHSENGGREATRGREGD